MERVTQVERDVVLGESRLVELFDRTIETFKRAPVTFLATTAVADVPLTVVGALLYYLAQNAEHNAWGSPRYIVQVSILAALFGAAMLLKLVSEGAVARAAGDLLGLSGQPRTPSVTRAWRAALSSGAPLILLGMLRLIVMVFGLLIMGLPSLVAVVLMAYWAQVATLERRSTIQSLARLLTIARGGWHLVLILIPVFTFAFLVIFLNVLLMVRIGLLVVLAFTPFDASTIITLPVMLVGSVLLTRVLLEPLVGIGFTIAYVDARVRIEGYDMRVRAERAARAAHGSRPEAA